MRPVLFTLAATLFIGVAGIGQEAKKKEDKSPSKFGSMKEPDVTEVGGKNLDYWIKEISSKDPSKREAAMRTVLAFGPTKAQQAVPVILAELKKHSAKTPIDLSVRANGATALGTILGSAKEPDPKHIKEAVAILRRFCRDEQWIVRTRAVQALKQLGPEALSALSDVIAVAQDPDTWDARQAGLDALTTICLADSKPPASATLFVYYRALKDNSMPVRIMAVRALAEFHYRKKLDQTTNTVVLRNIDELLKDPEPAVQIWAHLAEITIKEKVDTVHLMPVAKMLENADPTIRVQGAQALAQIGPGAKPASGNLIAALHDPDLSVVAASIIALVSLEASNAVPALQKLADENAQNLGIRQAALDAIDAIRRAANKKQDGKDKQEKK
jgi:HEAT repeat protein